MFTPKKQTEHSHETVLAELHELAQKEAPEAFSGNAKPSPEELVATLLPEVPKDITEQETLNSFSRIISTCAKK